MAVAKPSSLEAAAAHEASMAPWIREQLTLLLPQQGHAWLLQGPSGLGQYRLALELARTWLCENPGSGGACLRCNSCHAIDVRTHADLCVLMPETVMPELGWPLSESAQDDIDQKKRKPSREIRVESMRDAIEFAQRTSSRGQGKVVLVFPAEDMNTVTANALLKTLEEPPGHVRFVLASESAHRLLPTIRSRCQTHTMHWPDTRASLEWLQAQGLGAGDAASFFAASGGRPDDARAWAATGRTAAQWIDFPQAMLRGDASLVKDWSAAELIDSLQKLCHDLMAHKAGAQTRFFDQGKLAPMSKVTMAALTHWSRQLSSGRKTMNHPFQPGLMQEALIENARFFLNL